MQDVIDLWSGKVPHDAPRLWAHALGLQAAPTEASVPEACALQKEKLVHRSEERPPARKTRESPTQQ